MNSTTIITGRALAATEKSSLFEDPRWEERFDVLIRLTQRTQLIQELTGTDVNAQRLKDVIDRRIRQMGGTISRPRGKGQEFTSKGFLSKLADKYDAAYLLGLHFGANGPGGASAAETNLGAALDKRLETYLRYRADLYEHQDDARISFETYIVMLRGIRNREVTVHSCGDCSSRYVWAPGTATRPYCPICTHMQLNAVEARSRLESLLASKAAEKHAPKVRAVG